MIWKAFVTKKIGEIKDLFVTLYVNITALFCHSAKFNHAIKNFRPNHNTKPVKKKRSHKKRERFL